MARTKTTKTADADQASTPAPAPVVESAPAPVVAEKKVKAPKASKAPKAEAVHVAPVVETVVAVVWATRCCDGGPDLELGRRPAWPANRGLRRDADASGFRHLHLRPGCSDRPGRRPGRLKKPRNNSVP